MYDTDQYIEKYYAEIETETAPIYSELISQLLDVNYTPQQEVKENLSRFLVSQIERTNRFREESYQFTLDMYKEFKEKGFTKEQLKQFGFEDENYDKKQVHLESILAGIEMDDTLMEILSDHIWMFFKNETTQCFYTSDHPVVKKSNLNNDLISNDGYGSPGIEIAFPLTPKLILLMFDREYFYEQSERDCHVLNMNSIENVDYYNSMQAAFSQRQIYSYSNKFELINEMGL